MITISNSYVHAASVAEHVMLLHHISRGHRPREIGFFLENFLISPEHLFSFFRQTYDYTKYVEF